MNEPTAKEKAQAGLWMIREAILELLREKKVPLQPHEVRDELGLQSDECPTPGIAPAVMKMLNDEGKLEKGEGLRPSYRLPTGGAG